MNPSDFIEKETDESLELRKQNGFNDDETEECWVGIDEIRKFLNKCHEHGELGQWLDEPKLSLDDAIVKLRSEGNTGVDAICKYWSIEEKDALKTAIRFFKEWKSLMRQLAEAQQNFESFRENEFADVCKDQNILKKLEDAIESHRLHHTNCLRNVHESSPELIEHKQSICVLEELQCDIMVIKKEESAK